MSSSLCLCILWYKEGRDFFQLEKEPQMQQLHIRRVMNLFCPWKSAAQMLREKSCVLWSMWQFARIFSKAIFWGKHFFRFYFIKAAWGVWSRRNYVLKLEALLKEFLHPLSWSCVCVCTHIYVCRHLRVLWYDITDVNNPNTERCQFPVAVTDIILLRKYLEKYSLISHLNFHRLAIPAFLLSMLPLTAGCGSELTCFWRLRALWAGRVCLVR